MTAQDEHRLAALLVLGAALVALGAWAWGRVAGRASVPERALVGTWELRHDDGYMSQFRTEYEFRPDRTCGCRVYDRATGAPHPPAVWRVRGLWSPAGFGTLG